MVKVALKSCADYEENEVFEAILHVINELGGIEKFISPGMKVLIKPNMLTATLPTEAVCTHPTIVRAVISLVKQAGGQPYIGDSPAIGNAHKVAAKNGIAKICEDLKVPLVDFDQPQEVSFPDGLVCKRFTIDKQVLDADVVINVPKLKTHGLTFLTCGVKNLYGCITGKQKAEFHLRMPSHLDFAKMLVDLYRLVKPTLTIMDGIIGMEGAGPRNGKPRKIGVILASTSAVALDATATHIIGIPPLDIPTTRLAIEHGVDIKNVADINVIGEPVDRFIIKDFKQSKAFASFRNLPQPVVSFFQNQLTAKPSVSDKCLGCGICQESCPPQIIQMHNKKAHISYDKCIRCYCCQELCPHDAIDLKRGLVGKMLFKN